MLSEKIRLLRLKNNMTQAELGIKSDFSQQEISLIERGIRKRFTEYELDKLAGALGVKVSCLTGNKEGECVGSNCQY